MVEMDITVSIMEAVVRLVAVDPSRDSPNWWIEPSRWSGSNSRNHRSASSAGRARLPPWTRTAREPAMVAGLRCSSLADLRRSV